MSQDIIWEAPSGAIRLRKIIVFECERRFSREQVARRLDTGYVENLKKRLREEVAVQTLEFVVKNGIEIYVTHLKETEVVEGDYTTWRIRMTLCEKEHTI